MIINRLNSRSYLLLQYVCTIAKNGRGLPHILKLRVLQKVDCSFRVLKNSEVVNTLHCGSKLNNPTKPRRQSMKHYIGLDVSMKQSSICIVDEVGAIVFEKDVVTNPNEIYSCIVETGLNIQLAGLESGSLSHWLVDMLGKLGLPTICVCSRKMAAILELTINKTDKNDARGIAQALRAGYYRKVHHKSQHAVELSTLMGARRSLVSQRTNSMNTIRGLFKSYGIIVGIANTTRFFAKIEKLIEKLTKDSQIGVKSLLECFETVNLQVILMDKRVEKIALEDPVIKRFITIPGIGPITALTFKMVIDDPLRFKKSRSVGAYVGATPTQYSSGETHRQGKVSKCGSSELRYLLCEAATSMMLRTKCWNKDKAWAHKVMKKHGFGKARMALARKLAVKMHRMWVDEKDYEWIDVKPEEIKALEKAQKNRKKSKNKQDVKKTKDELELNRVEAEVGELVGV
jgi:transposase